MAAANAGLRDKTLVFFYSPKLSSWLGKSSLIARDTTGVGSADPDAQRLVAVPTITRDARLAAMMRIEVDESNDERIGNRRLRPTDAFRVRAMENNTTDAVYLGAVRGSNLAGAGQPVQYMNPSERESTLWKVSAQSKGVGAPSDSLVVGAPYVLHNVADGSVLRAHPTMPRLVSAYEDPPETEWIMVPSGVLYTCQQDIGQCQRTAGWNNLNVNPRCETQNGVDQCKDQFGQSVYFTMQDCQSVCGRDTIAGASSANTSTPNTPNTPNTTNPSPRNQSQPQSSLWKFILLAVVAGLVVGALAGYAAFRAGRRGRT